MANPNRKNMFSGDSDYDSDYDPKERAPHSTITQHDSFEDVTNALKNLHLADDTFHSCHEDFENSTLDKMMEDVGNFNITQDMKSLLENIIENNVFANDKEGAASLLDSTHVVSQSKSDERESISPVFSDDERLFEIHELDNPIPELDFIGGQTPIDVDVNQQFKGAPSERNMIPKKLTLSMNESHFAPGALEITSTVDDQASILMALLQNTFSMNNTYSRTCDSITEYNLLYGDSSAEDEDTETKIMAEANHGTLPNVVQSLDMSNTPCDSTLTDSKIDTNEVEPKQEIENVIVPVKSNDINPCDSTLDSINSCDLKMDKIEAEEDNSQNDEMILIAPPNSIHNSTGSVDEAILDNESMIASPILVPDIIEPICDSVTVDKDDDKKPIPTTMQHLRPSSARSSTGSTDESILDYETLIQASPTLLGNNVSRFQKQSELKLKINQLQQANAALKLALIQKQEAILKYEREVLELSNATYVDYSLKKMEQMRNANNEQVKMLENKCKETLLEKLQMQSQINDLTQKLKQTEDLLESEKEKNLEMKTKVLLAESALEQTAKKEQTVIATLNAKYEKCKEVILKMRENEAEMKKYTDGLETYKSVYLEFKRQAQETIEKANLENSKLKLSLEKFNLGGSKR